MRTSTLRKVLPALAIGLAAGLCGCAKEECYECAPPSQSPFTETEKVCAKGQDLEVQLAWYRTQGYSCTQAYSSAYVTGPFHETSGAYHSEIRPGRLVREYD
jgi:hypothetical protein